MDFDTWSSSGQGLEELSDAEVHALIEAMSGDGQGDIPEAEVRGVLGASSGGLDVQTEDPEEEEDYHDSGEEEEGDEEAEGEDVEECKKKIEPVGGDMDEGPTLPALATQPSPAAAKTRGGGSLSTCFKLYNQDVRFATLVESEKLRAANRDLSKDRLFLNFENARAWVLGVGEVDARQCVRQGIPADGTRPQMVHSTKNGDSQVTYICTNVGPNGDVCSFVSAIGSIVKLVWGEESKIFTCCNSGKIIPFRSRLARRLTAYKLHSGFCDEKPRRDVCQNCNEICCVGKVTDVVEDVTGRQASYPYSKCNKVCKSCKQRACRGFLFCGKSLDLSDGTASAPLDMSVACMYSKADLAYIYWRELVKAGHCDVHVAARSKDRNVRAVLAHYVRPQIDNKKKLTSLYSKVKGLTQHLFDSHESEDGRIERDLTFGIGNLDAVGARIVKDDEPVSGPQYPAGQRTAFAHKSVDGNTFAATMMRKALAAYKRRMTFLSSPAGMNRVASYDPSVRNCVTWDETKKTLKLVDFREDKLTLPPKSYVDKLEFAKVEEQRLAVAKAANRGAVRKIFVQEESDGPLRTVPRAQEGNWEQPVAANTRRYVGSFPESHKFFYSWCLVRGEILRLLQSCPWYLSIDAAHIRFQRIAGGVILRISMRDLAKSVHLLAQMYTIDCECNEAVTVFLDFLRGACLPRNIFDGTVVYTLDQGPALISVLKKSINLELSAARLLTGNVAHLYHDWWHLNKRMSKTDRSTFLSMSRTTSVDAYDRLFLTLSAPGQKKALKAGPRQAQINLPNIIRGSLGSQLGECSNNFGHERDLDPVKALLEENGHRARYRNAHNAALTTFSLPNAIIPRMSQQSRKTTENDESLFASMTLEAGQHQSQTKLFERTHTVKHGVQAFGVRICTPITECNQQQMVEAEKVKILGEDVYYSVPSCNCGRFHPDERPCHHVFFLLRNLCRLVELSVQTEDWKRDQLPLRNRLDTSLYSYHCRARALSFAYQKAGLPIPSVRNLELTQFEPTGKGDETIATTVPSVGVQGAQKRLRSKEEGGPKVANDADRAPSRFQMGPVSASNQLFESMRGVLSPLEITLVSTADASLVRALAYCVNGDDQKYSTVAASLARRTRSAEEGELEAACRQYNTYIEKITISNEKPLQRSILHVKPLPERIQTLLFEVGDEVEALPPMCCSPSDWHQAVVEAVPDSADKNFYVRFVDRTFGVRTPVLSVKWMRHRPQQMHHRCIRIAEHADKPGMYFPWVWSSDSASSFLDELASHYDEPSSVEVSLSKLRDATRTLPFFKEEADGTMSMRCMGMEHAVHPHSTLQSLKPETWLTEDVLNFVFLLCARDATARGLTVGKLTMRLTTRMRSNLATEVEKGRFRDQVTDDVRVVIVPFCSGMHYTLALLFPRRQTVLYFDPYGPSSHATDFLDAAFECYAQLREAARLSPPPPHKAWKKISSKVTYQSSSDSVNCGVFCAMIVHNVTACNPGALLHFSSVAYEETRIEKHVNMYRETITGCFRSRFPVLHSNYVNLLGRKGDDGLDSIITFDEAQRQLLLKDVRVFLKVGRVPLGVVVELVSFSGTLAMAMMTVVVVHDGQRQTENVGNLVKQRGKSTIDL